MSGGRGWVGGVPKSLIHPLPWAKHRMGLKKRSFQVSKPAGNDVRSMSPKSRPAIMTHGLRKPATPHDTKENRHER